MTGSTGLYLLRSYERSLAKDTQRRFTIDDPTGALPLQISTGSPPTIALATAGAARAL